MPKARQSYTRGAACIGSGYRYQLAWAVDWKRSRDEEWETKVGRKFCGRVLGTRRIDGAPVTVIKRGKIIVAATSQSVRKRAR